MNTQHYPKWIDEYARSIHQAWRGMAPNRYEMADPWTFLGLTNHLFVPRLCEAIDRFEASGRPLREAAAAFANPSQLRVEIMCLAIGYQLGHKRANAKQSRRAIDFILGLLRERVVDGDLFGYRTNRTHTSDQVTDLGAAATTQGSPESARELGRLYTVAAGLTFALFRDFYPQQSNEQYGPYFIEKSGETLVVKEFTALAPHDLWPEAQGLKHHVLRLITVYESVDFRIEFIGMHPRTQSDLIAGLRRYGVELDGAPYPADEASLRQLRNHFLELSVANGSLYESLSSEGRRLKLAEWQGYVYKDFFELVGMDWRPPAELISLVKQSDLPDHFSITDVPDFETFAASKDNEVYWLKELYRSQPATGGTHV